MAQEDFAILVGISRYRHSERFPALDGPLNDVDRIYDWLLGEDVPAGNIKVLKTDASLLGLTHDQIRLQPRSIWTPTYPLYSQMFLEVVQDQQSGDFRYSEGRLYLYFSGHGFSNSRDVVPRAALFAADAWGVQISNIAGSLYAEAVQQGALFKEVVLIMDCCRDSEINVPYNIPDVNVVEDPASQSVKVLQIYATPKRGKAQERALPGPGDKVVGLLTHGFLKALEEAAADVSGRVPSATLKGLLQRRWAQWYPELTPPTPRVQTPNYEDIFFRSLKPLVQQRFVLPRGILSGVNLGLESTEIQAFGTFLDEAVRWRATNDAWEVDVGLRDAGGGNVEFMLKLDKTRHDLKFSDPGRPSISFTPGEIDVILS